MWIEWIFDNCILILFVTIFRICKWCVCGSAQLCSHTNIDGLWQCYAQPPILTTLYFYIAQLTVHWEILEIHRAGRCYRQSKKVFDVRIGPWQNKLNIKKQDILYTQWKIQICSRNVESRKVEENQTCEESTAARTSNHRTRRSPWHHATHHICHTIEYRLVLQKVPSEGS